MSYSNYSNYNSYNSYKKCCRTVGKICVISFHKICHFRHSLLNRLCLKWQMDILCMLLMVDG